MDIDHFDQSGSVSIPTRADPEFIQVRTLGYLSLGSLTRYGRIVGPYHNYWLRSLRRNGRHLKLHVCFGVNSYYH